MTRRGTVRRGELNRLYPNILVTGRIDVTKSYFNEAIRSEFYKLTMKAGASRKPYPKYHYGNKEINALYGK